jgi:menaquinone-dependent protoporphyrinogen oxidase
MARILIVHASFDGQTRRICERIAAIFRTSGHEVTLRDAQSPMAAANITDHDAVVIGGAVRVGHFARSLERLVRGRAASLESRPNAFFSVCMAARDPVRGPAVARGYADKFLASTGWNPQLTANFAGALQYTHYNPFVRFLMRLISKAAGGDTDTSRDYEYTDWAAVERFAREFAALVPHEPIAEAA